MAEKVRIGPSTHVGFGGGGRWASVPEVGTLRAKAAALLAAVCFPLYVLLRPYSSESGLDGASAWASWQWVAAHLLGMAAFSALGWWALALVGPRRPAVLLTLGVAAILPYYGAEAFALRAVGRTALATADPATAALGDSIRYDGAALTLFGLGLAAIAAGTLWCVIVRRRGEGMTGRIALWAVAACAALYLPQFFLPPLGRVAHGLALGAALGVWVAAQRPLSSVRSRGER